MAFLIGVAGGSCSGKTTLCRELVSILGADTVALVHHDSYYRDLQSVPETERAQINFDHPDSLETELTAAHLQRLKSGEPIDVPQYDFATHARLPQRTTISSRPVVLVEGVLVLAEERLRNQLDLRLFVDIPADIRFARRLQRDHRERGRTVDSIVEQYLATVRPMHEQFVEPSKQFAELIIPEAGTRSVIDLVRARMQAWASEFPKRVP